MSITKNIFLGVAKIFTVAVLIVVFLSTFFLGLFSGYIKGRTDTQNELMDYKNISGLSPTNPSTPTPTPIITGSELPDLIVDWGSPELWDEINKRRSELNVNELIERNELCALASIRLNELLELGFLDEHAGFSKLSEESSDLKWIFEKNTVIAEFLAMGGATPQETVSLWENTLSHKKLLSGKEFIWGCVYSQNTFAVAIVAY